MNSKYQYLRKGTLCLLILFIIVQCKHEKKNSNEENLFLLQLLSGFSFPGPKAEWTRLAGIVSKTTVSNAITSDSSNNVYVTGYTTGNLDGQPLTGIQDSFIIKYNSSGVKQWTRASGVAASYTSSYSTVSDPSGNVYSIGTTDGALDGETFNGTANWDTNMFIIKYDSNGNKQWTRLSGQANGNINPKNITIDSIGNVYLTGGTASGLDGQNYTGSEGYFLMKYNSSGIKQWTIVFAGPTPSAVAFDNMNSKIFITGFIFNLNSMDGIARTGAEDAFLIKLDSNGNKLWTKLLGSPGQRLNSNSVSVDTSGNAYITGLSSASIDGQTKSGGYYDLLIAKYDPNGNRVWTRLLGVTGDFFSVNNRSAIGNGISVTKDSNLFITGSTTGNLDGQSHSDVLSGSAKNLFLTKYDLDGNKKWTTLSGSKGYTIEINGLTTDSTNHPYVTGYTNGPLNGEAYIGTPKSLSNLFIIKF
ncbi:SBBP repeat-containing protein [Leptospira santarosai]|uniref:SBBP repeat-containing protein n=1 Tax=Leptospira santarosai TaxID=28183 RepID=UPI0007744C97|nr:SBBP repeat-containing protein [Leptospira santarosai]MDI7230300.1 SBBP repeat-containing protein [Leptospira santarosai]